MKGSALSKIGTSVTKLANTLEIKSKLEAVVKGVDTVFEVESRVEAGRAAVDEGDGDGLELTDGVVPDELVPDGLLYDGLVLLIRLVLFNGLVLPDGLVLLGRLVLKDGLMLID